MRIILLVLVLLWSQTAAAATYVGNYNARFQVTERLDGVVTTLVKIGPARFVMNTDYDNIKWSMSFDVDLLMAGGPEENFETRLRATGVLTPHGD
jgi:hypothetical protein